MGTTIKRSMGLLLATGLAACNNSQPLVASKSLSIANCDQLFSQVVQSNLGYCRSCHVPQGVADTADGHLFMLSNNPAEDFGNLRSSWERLGKNSNGPSRILKMASGTDSRSHTGGAPWPVGSEAYRAMDAQLQGFDNPAACVLTIQTNDAGDYPLLGSKHAKHLWASYCEGKPDDAVLPADPRTLVRPGVNQNKAVYFNAWWQDCHANLPDQQPAKTCGEYRTRRDIGRDFLMNVLPSGSTTAADFNDSWKKWGLTARPDNFDAMYTLRYGLNRAPFDNPYPVRKPDGTLEDPNQTHGGSGQLPLGLRQMKDANGKWTSTIGTAACFQCHGGQIGDPDNQITMANLGLGNNNYDVVMSGQDNSPFAGTPASNALPGLSIDSLFNIGIKQRGQNNAVGAFELLVTLLDLDSLGLNPNVMKNEVGVTGLQDTAHPLAHTQDTPAWWNMGSRPRKFFEAGVSNDSTRIIMAAGASSDLLVTPSGKSYRDRIKQYDRDLEAFFLSLQSPEYPRPIDNELAQQGAILFHTKNLWAPELNNPVPKPLGGNGSCAGCHGAYSPRFVHDPSFLADPVLEGVAAHISPLNVIGTDRARSDMLTPTLRNRWDTTYWGFTDGVPGWVDPEKKDYLTETADDMWLAPADVPPLTGTPAVRPAGLCGWEKEVIGYQAPPLYGTWATAPYFHNGSVPTIEAVLDSSQRHPIWQRQTQTMNGVTGFDQSLERAYDFDALGWKSVAMTCAQMPGTEQMNCNPVDDNGPSLTQLVNNLIDSSVSWLGLVTIPDPKAGSIDKRLIYDTRILGNGNGGHEFTNVLTAQERRAIIEYLKTL